MKILMMSVSFLIFVSRAVSFVAEIDRNAVYFEVTEVDWNSNVKIHLKFGLCELGDNF